MLSNPDFRRLWLIGLGISVVRWLEMLALALVAYRLTASAFVVVMLTMLRMLPMALFGASSALPQSASILTRRYWLGVLRL